MTSTYVPSPHAAMGRPVSEFHVPQPVPQGAAIREIREGRGFFVDSSGMSGDWLSCSSCHLNGGTDLRVLPLVGVATTFPRMVRRYHRWMTLSQRINRCVVNSLAGRSLGAHDPDRRDLTAYLYWLSTGYAKGSRLPWLRHPTLLEPDSPPNVAHGKKLYHHDCAYCHGPRGMGFFHGSMAPPLWGPHSYTRGAGMDRMAELAAFIKAAMPAVPLGGVAPGGLSATHAKDLAAFILKHPRPKVAIGVGDSSSDIGHHPHGVSSTKRDL